MASQIISLFEGSLVVKVVLCYEIFHLEEALAFECFVELRKVVQMVAQVALVA